MSASPKFEKGKAAWARVLSLDPWNTINFDVSVGQVVEVLADGSTCPFIKVNGKREPWLLSTKMGIQEDNLEPLAGPLGVGSRARVVGVNGIRPEGLGLVGTITSVVSPESGSITFRPDSWPFPAEYGVVKGKEIYLYLRDLEPLPPAPGGQASRGPCREPWAEVYKNGCKCGGS